MYFSNLLSTEIMPLVNARDKSTPFIISKQNGEWIVNYPYPAETAQTYLDDIRKTDPCAVCFIGSDFAKGSFPYVYDKIMTARLRAEYETLQYSAATLLEYNAVVNFFEDNLCELSAEVADYMTLDRPLYDMNGIKPFALFNTQAEYGYDEDKVMDYISLIENHVKKCLEERAENVELNGGEKTMPELKTGDFIDYDNKRWHVDYVSADTIQLTNLNPLDSDKEIRASHWKDHITEYTVVDKSEVDMSTLTPPKAGRKLSFDWQDDRKLPIIDMKKLETVLHNGGFSGDEGRPSLMDRVEKGKQKVAQQGQPDTSKANEREVLSG